MHDAKALTAYLSEGIETIVTDIAKASLRYPKESAYMLRFAAAARKAAKQREKHDAAGLHVPPFLIASIATQCNLHCAGCYARAGGACGSDAQASAEMTAEQWRDVFRQAAELGISFILLAGGEPLMRPDILDVAAEFPDIIFPIFTNGTLIQGDHLRRFDAHRNLLPVLSIEGDAPQTDARRGSGVAQQVAQAMEALKGRGMLFGASLTVTTENLDTVIAPDFAATLSAQGCAVLFFIEYVPAEIGTEALVLGESDLLHLASGIDALKADPRNRHTVLLSFPGDEHFSGGCLAAGRGFFHINASGGAEPCPFSPYSALNMRKHSLADVLRSPFFEQVRGISQADTSHVGGCTLLHHETAVKAALQR